MEMAIRATTGPTIYVSSCTMLEPAGLALISLSFPRSDVVRVKLGWSSTLVAVVTLCSSCAGMLAVFVGGGVFVLSGCRRGFFVVAEGVVSVAITTGCIESMVVERHSSVWLERQVESSLLHLKFFVVEGHMPRKVPKSMSLQMHW